MSSSLYSKLIRHKAHSNIKSVNKIGCCQDDDRLIDEQLCAKQSNLVKEPKALLLVPGEVDCRFNLYNMPKPSLLEATELYYLGINSIYGNKPFEFMLNRQLRHKTLIDMGIDKWEIRDERISEWLFSKVPFLEALVIDTGNFIANGKREINIFTLLNLSRDSNTLSAECKENYNFPDISVYKKYDNDFFDNMSSVEFFNRWIKHRDGIQDLINSHKVMFGY